MMQLPMVLSMEGEAPLLKGKNKRRRRQQAAQPQLKCQCVQQVPVLRSIVNNENLGKYDVDIEGDDGNSEADIEESEEQPTETAQQVKRPRRIRLEQKDSVGQRRAAIIPGSVCILATLVKIRSTLHH